MPSPSNLLIITSSLPWTVVFRAERQARIPAFLPWSRGRSRHAQERNVALPGRCPDVLRVIHAHGRNRAATFARSPAPHVEMPHEVAATLFPLQRRVSSEKTPFFFAPQPCARRPDPTERSAHFSLCGYRHNKTLAPYMILFSRKNFPDCFHLSAGSLRNGKKGNKIPPFSSHASKHPCAPKSEWRDDQGGFPFEFSNVP